MSKPQNHKLQITINKWLSLVTLYWLGLSIIIFIATCSLDGAFD